MVGTRAQSGDRHGSGMPHPGQVLRGSLPLLSPPLDIPTFAAKCLNVRNEARDPSSERRERSSGNFAYTASLITPLGIFYMPQIYDMDRRLYFPSEGRRAEDFFALKNPTASAGFEPTNLGTKVQHAIPRPPKPLYKVYNINKYLKVLNFINSKFLIMFMERDMLRTVFGIFIGSGDATLSAMESY